MSKKKQLRSFWDFEPSQTNKRNPFAVDPDFDAKNAAHDDKGPAITSLPRAMMKSVKKPLTKQKQQIAAPAPTSQKSGGGVWVGLTVLVVAVLILSQTHLLRNVTTFFNAKKVEEVAIKPSTGPVLGEVKPAEAMPTKEKIVVTKTTTTPTISDPVLRDLVGKKVTVKTAFLNVRSDTSLSAPIVGNVKKGDEVTIVGVKRRWLQIGENRYIGASHVNLDGANSSAETPVVAEQKEKEHKEPKEKPAPKTTSVAKKKFVQHQKIATDNIKIRSGAGPKNKVVGYLRKGAVVTVYEQKGIWLKIGEDRYVHSGNLKTQDSVGH